MRRRSAVKASQCLDLCAICSIRWSSPRALNELPRTRSRQIRFSSTFPRQSEARSSVQNGSESTPATQSTPGSSFGKPAFAGGGWSGPTFNAQRSLTPEEIKQRQTILQKSVEQEEKKPASASQQNTQPEDGPPLAGERGHWACFSCGQVCSPRRFKCVQCGRPRSREPYRAASGSRDKLDSFNRVRLIKTDKGSPLIDTELKSLQQAYLQRETSSNGSLARIRRPYLSERQEAFSVVGRKQPDRYRAANRVPEEQEASSTDRGYTAHDSGRQGHLFIRKYMSPSRKPTSEILSTDSENATRKTAGPATEIDDIDDLEVENVGHAQRYHSQKPKKWRSNREDDEDDDYRPRKERSRQSRRPQEEGFKQPKQPKAPKPPKPTGPTPIYLPEFISVGNLANALGMRPARFLRRLEEFGFEEDVTYSHILDSETAGLIASEFGFSPMPETAGEDLVAGPEPEDTSSLPSRPPVVTIMGHVDHGKTTILDYLRKSSVAASEFGGITQHIGAFSVQMPSGKMITFLDTPGHAAFLDMRRRGAVVTDIVIIVVAADDSVKPQTIEAIKHAKESGVPIMVAINKVDKEGIDVERVKQDLARYNVMVEDIGGDVQAIPVSGKTGQGMDDLEEAVVTLSELLDHRAPKDGNVEGWIIEGTTKLSGRAATVLVKRGTLRPGDIVVAGTTWARIRTLKNEAGVVVDEALPGTPVEVDGWKEQPQAGTEVLQASDEQLAKDVVETRLSRIASKKMGEDVGVINEARKADQTRRAELRDRHRQGLEDDGILQDGEVTTSGPKPVQFIVKADVSGSTEAVVNSIAALGNNEVYPRVLRPSVGQIGQSDVEYAAAANAHIVTFNVPVEPAMYRLAESLGVKILNHNIIYELIDDVKSKLSEHLAPIVKQHVTGEAEIGQVFNITLRGRATKAIAGCKVKNGLINRSSKVKVLRNKEVVYEGTLSSLKNVKKDVTEMRKGTECGLGFEDWAEFEVGDHVQCYEEVSEERHL